MLWLPGTFPEEPVQTAIPTDYHGISFDYWLDVFLQYSLIVAGQGEREEAYDTLAAAADASVWYHTKASTRQIHICWFVCALRAQDEETLSNEARWFIKEYQFVTDTYRLFAMLSRLCGDPHRSLFHSSPNMKFMLRQIKAVDYSLPEEYFEVHGGHDSGAACNSKPGRESVYKERVSLTSRDEETGETIKANEMDVALLVLYGHILYSGSSFYPALNYLFRAYALDPENPAVLLSIALCFIHHSLKRQSENRHYLIMQGLSFMHEYRRVRGKQGSLVQERQEVEFNFARVWHMLGLAHLAVQGYRRVLELVDELQDHDDDDVTMGGTVAEQPPPFVEDFSCEAALGLQNIYAHNGDLYEAREITKRWLVI